MSWVFVTANLGSLPGLAIQNQQALSKTLISCLRFDKVKFVAYHFQEAIDNVTKRLPDKTENLFKSILREAFILKFTKVLVLIDGGDLSNIHTGLASIYLGRQDFQNVQLTSFQTNISLEFDGVKVYTQALQTCEITFKHKFEHKGRKGLLQTRWRLNNIVIDLVNIHLFHDKNNLISVQSFPNDASILRKDILHKELIRLRQNPFIIFGDFNFRLNQPEVIQVMLTEYAASSSCTSDAQRVACDTTESEIVFKDLAKNGTALLTVGRKTFQMNAALNGIYHKNIKQFIHFDQEPREFMEDLFELPITFPPSYPFSTESNEYRGTRCVAWCDRVFISSAMKQTLPAATHRYDCLDDDSLSTGDHKPVFLHLTFAKEDLHLAPATDLKQAPSCAVLNGEIVPLESIFQTSWQS